MSFLACFFFFALLRFSLFRVVLFCFRLPEVRASFVSRLRAALSYFVSLPWVSRSRTGLPQPPHGRSRGVSSPLRVVVLLQEDGGNKNPRDRRGTQKTLTQPCPPRYPCLFVRSGWCVVEKGLSGTRRPSHLYFRRRGPCIICSREYRASRDSLALSEVSFARGAGFPPVRALPEASSVGGAGGGEWSGRWGPSLPQLRYAL